MMKVNIFPVFSENKLFIGVFEVIHVWTLFRIYIQSVPEFYPLE